MRELDDLWLVASSGRLLRRVWLGSWHVSWGDLDVHLGMLWWLRLWAWEARRHKSTKEVLETSWHIRWHKTWR